MSPLSTPPARGRCRPSARRLGVLAVALATAFAGSVSAAQAAGNFTLLDLGTVGGSYSDAVAISETGQVAGWSTTAGETGRHAFSWTRAGGMVDLGTLGGGGSEAVSVGDGGHVVGWSQTRPFGPRHAFSWTEPGGMVDLGTLGGAGSGAFAVNGSGQVVGYSETPSGAVHAFSWTPEGGMLDLGTLGGAISVALDVADDGEVVGWSWTEPLSLRHAFSWTPEGGMVDLGTLGGFSAALRISESGQIVGESATLSGATHGFSWTRAGGMVDLGTLGGASSSALALNGNGQIVGWAATPDGRRHAFSRAPTGVMTDLGFLGSGWQSEAAAVNAGGQVVGWSLTGEINHELAEDISFGRAFSWTRAGGLVDLGTLRGDSWARALNDSGQVAGGSNATALWSPRAVLWDPVLAPSITSSPSATFTVGVPGIFTITTSSWPEAAITITGDLPTGIAFVDNSDGTATLSGTPQLGTGGVHPLTVTASNGVAPMAVQSLQLSVRYVFGGFLQPVVAGVVVANAGRAIPLKFDLGGDQGLGILAPGSPRSVAVDCGTGSVIGGFEPALGAGTRELRFDGIYSYVWTTLKQWSGTCRRFELKFVDEQLFTVDVRFAG